MNIFYKLYCHAVHLGVKLASPLIRYRAPRIVDYEEAAMRILRANLGHALLVTGPAVLSNGLCDPLLAVLQRAGIEAEIFKEVPSDPTLSCVEKALSLYRERGCDCVIAVGGGSPMDCAKGVCARIASPPKSLLKMKGALKVGRNVPLLIAVPTTAGTGSEATAAAVFTNEENHEKFAVFSPHLVPKFAILDPELTRTMPPSVTADTGMDALTHAVEAYIGGATTAETRALCEKSVSRIKHNLYAAYADVDFAAREEMQLAAYEAGVAFTRSYVGYVHALAHALGATFRPPHGRLCAVLLPVVLKAYGTSCTKKLANLARTCGVCDPSSSDMDAADAFIEWIEDLNCLLFIPQSIRIDKRDIPALCRRAAKEANPLYPVPKLLGVEELEKVCYAVRAETKKK